MESKVCSKCDTEKSLDQYYLIKKTGYVYSYCKKCHYSLTKPTAKKWRKKFPDRWKQDVRKAQKDMWDRQREGVYLLITSKGLYIGQTDKYESRIHQHRHSNFNGNMKYKGAKIFYATLLEEINNREERLDREKYWIKKLKPNLNKMYNDDWVREKKQGGKYVKK